MNVDKLDKKRNEKKSSVKRNLQFEKREREREREREKILKNKTIFWRFVIKYLDYST